MKQFSRSFTDWTLSHDDAISITHVESKGDNLHELLNNAEISFEDWHGNPRYFAWSAWDLSQPDFSELESIFSHFLDEQRVKNA
jgi:hypothetical protein